jgi:beta-glucanase (GH16 family)
MTHPVRPSAKGRRRVWIAAASVGGIVVATTAVGAVELNGKGPGAPTGTKAAAPAAANAAAQAAKLTLPKVKWKVSWHDEFRGRGKPSKYWSPVTGNGTNGWSHHALHYYRAGNAYQNGKGALVISAAKTGPKDRLRCWNGKCKYTSARIQTSGKFQQAYGRFAVRAKLPTGKGVWPAFWMQRASRPYGEIDVVETIGSKPNLVQGYAHQTRRVGGGTYALRRPLSAGFHTYGVDWTPHRVVWWVDGHPYAQLKRYKGWVFNKPFYLILNIQVGGSWPGTPTKATRFPARMQVDWVRVFRASK